MKKKNILYLNHVSNMGGGEWSLFQLMKNLDRNKYKPYLLVQEPGPLSEKAKDIGIETYFLKMRAWRKVKYMPLNYLVTLPKLKILLKDLNIDLVHCNAYRLNPYAVLAAESRGIPCITHIRWFRDRGHIRKFKLNETDILITISKYIASFFPDSDNVEVIYNGIDISKFKHVGSNKIREEFSISKDDFVIGMVAQLTPRKGHKDFIKAASLVKNELPQAKFLCVGGGILEKHLTLNDLKEYAREVGADNVIFTGQRDDIVDIFHALDCFVLPSHIEPFGRVILEAMASKIPVIATKSGGPEEIIEHGKNGLLVSKESPGEIADEILRLENNSNFSNFLSNNGFKKVKNEFNIDNYVNQIEKIYRRKL